MIYFSVVDCCRGSRWSPSAALRCNHRECTFHRSGILPVSGELNPRIRNPPKVNISEFAPVSIDKNEGKHVFSSLALQAHCDLLSFQKRSESMLRTLLLVLLTGCEQILAFTSQVTICPSECICLSQSQVSNDLSFSESYDLRLPVTAVCDVRPARDYAPVIR